MKKLFYFLFIIILSSACSWTSENDENNYGTSEGTASSPVELTIGTAKNGSVGRLVDSFYKFTTSSGAGSYKLNIASLAILDSLSSYYSVGIEIYSDSGYTNSSYWDDEYCMTDCTAYFDYKNLDNNTTYYLIIDGYGAVTYSLTVSKGGSEGSINNPVALTLSTAHSGTIDNVEYGWDKGYSYYKFTTSTAVDNYTLSMNNSDSLDCQLYSNSGFSTAVTYSSYNDCTAGTSLSETFTGGASSGASSGLSANTTYYLRIDGESSSAKTTTYNITVAPEG